MRIRADRFKNMRKGTYEAEGGVAVTGRIMEYLVAMVAVILCIVVPLYAKDGYYQIGNAKFAAYKTVMTGGSILLIVAVMPYLFFRCKEHRKVWLSVTDRFVLAYALLTGISVISGGFYEDVVWGSFGWNMGLMSQASFVLLYFFLSRFGRYGRVIITVLCGVSGIVYGIGILHRMMFDPIGFYEGLENYQKAQFLSTLGQATWYGSFLAVTLPVGIGVFIHCEQRVWKILSAIYMTLGFCTLVTQNSDSAYFALAGALVLLFVTSAEAQPCMCRFMGVLTLFFGAGKIMYFLMQIHPNPDLEVDFITNIMWTSKVTWILLFACFATTIALYVAETGGRKSKGSLKKVKGAVTVPVFSIGAVAGIVLVIFLQAQGALPEAISKRLDTISYFNWNDDWGNGRGRIWRFSAKVFSEENVSHKLFGVGPDGFCSYVSAYHGEEEELLWGEKMLTNAHNEWLNILINGGILGAAAYLGIYVTAIRGCLRDVKRDILLAGIAAAVVSYMCYNFFCYQQVLCTPFIFILVGLGEYILRRT